MSGTETSTQQIRAVVCLLKQVQPPLRDEQLCTSLEKGSRVSRQLPKGQLL